MGSRVPKTKRISESAIQKAILEYLAARHIFALRMNSGTQIGSYKGKKWAIHMNAAGTGDILAFVSEWRGVDDKGNWCEFREIRVYWFEVKTEDGKQSDLQKSFQAQVEAEGHRYFVVRSIEDVEAALK